MKNLILIFFLIIFTGSTGKAQDFAYFGAKGGVNLSNMSSDSFADSKFRTGFHIGLITQIPLGERFSLQAEILYATQGTEADVVMDGSGPRTTEYELGYVQVPVLAKMFLTESLSIEAGPSFNFLVNENINGEEGDFGSSFEFAGALGASYQLGGGFFGSARYTHGLTNAFDREYHDEDQRNTGFQLGIGLMF